MKSVKYLGISLMSILLLGSATTTLAADDPLEDNRIVNNGAGDTKTLIEIGDDEDAEGKDTLDPKDPEQKRLMLTDVPTEYKFATFVSDKDYDLKATLTNNNNIEVFNSLSKRKWHVLATVDGPLKADNAAQTEFDVTEFNIDGVDFVGTGLKAVVSQSETAPTIENNTGRIKKEVNQVSMKFTDGQGVLKAGNKLTGNIHYQLYNIPPVS